MVELFGSGCTHSVPNSETTVEDGSLVGFGVVGESSGIRRPVCTRTGGRMERGSRGLSCSPDRDGDNWFLLLGLWVEPGGDVESGHTRARQVKLCVYWFGLSVAVPYLREVLVDRLQQRRCIVVSPLSFDLLVQFDFPLYLEYVHHLLPYGVFGVSGAGGLVQFHRPPQIL